MHDIVMSVIYSCQDRQQFPLQMDILINRTYLATGDISGGVGVGANGVCRQRVWSIHNCNYHQQLIQEEVLTLVGLAWFKKGQTLLW